VINASVMFDFLIVFQTSDFIVRAFTAEKYSQVWFISALYSSDPHLAYRFQTL
jgi:hypothetical protein